MADRTRCSAFAIGLTGGSTVGQLPWWLSVKCCKGVTLLPLRKLAADRGWDVTLRQVVDHLRCDQCKQPPAAVHLMKDSSAQKGRLQQQKEWMLLA